MENALLEMAFQGGMNPEQLRGDCPRTREWPFNSRRKRMSVVHKTEDGEILLVKGAPGLLFGPVRRNDSAVDGEIVFSADDNL